MGDIYREICSWENLRPPHRRASRGKRGREAAAPFKYNLADNLIALQAELEDRTYRPGAYASFIIRDSKRRLISAAPWIAPRRWRGGFATCCSSTWSSSSRPSTTASCAPPWPANWTIPTCWGWWSGFWPAGKGA